MRVSLVIIVLIFILLVSACASPQETAQVASPIVASPTETVAVLPTRTPDPTQTPTATSTIAASTPMPTASPTPGPVWVFCSPLAEQSLDEIAEIVTDPYNPPEAGKDDRHHGTDFAYYRRKDRTTIAGEGVQAMLPGKVVAVVGDRLPYGNMVIIETAGDELPPALRQALGMASGESLYHLYAHFGAYPTVTLGEWVTCGTALGEVGATGYNIVNPHLHLEVRLGPAGADFSQGMAYYTTSASEIERSNYELWRTSGTYRHFDPMSLIRWYLNSQLLDH